MSGQESSIITLAEVDMEVGGGRNGERLRHSFEEEEGDRRSCVPARSHAGRVPTVRLLEMAVQLEPIPSRLVADYPPAPPSTPPPPPHDSDVFSFEEAPTIWSQQGPLPSQVRALSLSHNDADSS